MGDGGARWWRLLSVGGLVAVGSLVASGCGQSGPPVVTLYQLDDGKTLTAEPGSPVSILLPDLGDAASKWKITTQANHRVLEYFGSVHVPPSSDALLGNFGTDLYVYTAVGTGETKVVMKGVSVANGRADGEGTYWVRIDVRRS
jgi:predicted secreted protein